MRYRKRPLVIEAVQWTGQNVDEIKAFVGRRPGTAEQGFVLAGEGPEHEWNDASVWAEREGCWMRCPVDHWIIKGVTGEFYPCDPAVFDATYEVAS